MSIGPFLRREWTTSVRGSRAFADRWGAALMVSAMALGCFWVWDWNGWDRSSLAGGRRFTVTIAGLVVAGLGSLALALVIPQVAASIASERDRKTLNSLLASRFSSAEVVLGAIAAGLFRYANAWLATMPVVVMLVYFGGIPPPWAVLAFAGLASMAALLAAVAVAASVGARTAAWAMNVALGTVGAWFVLPSFFLMIRPLLWPGAPAWLVSTALVLADGSPMALVLHFIGLIPRTGGVAGVVLRMVGWQWLGTLALTVWAVFRLRPASRGLYDVEGQATRIKRLKAALGRPPRRPPCSDDPVFWHEAHGARGKSRFRRYEARALALASLAGIVLVTWWFARPAFEELAARGYGPDREAFDMPRIEPFARMLLGKLAPRLAAGLALGAAPGQARLEFNIILRELSAVLAVTLGISLFSAAFEGIKGEQRRDTWLGLISTPLEGREILRGKALGVLWRFRQVAYLLAALWTVGLLSGAVHPLGYLAEAAALAASMAFFPALGLRMALAVSHPERQKAPPITMIQAPIVVAGAVLLTVGPLLLAWASLFTYEDFQAAIQGRSFPETRELAESTPLRARTVAALCWVGVGALALGAVALIRSNARRFDAAIGRPVRAEVVAGSAPATPRVLINTPGRP